ncbi:MAG: methyltransferase [Epsilonproteobacteria bacterium]|nr:methyltransferase [Campylobacterota bacterium]OIO17669.1 MAG: methyltransferase [Helicobacteraceae bacterium CG1_02_36_14]PIP09661.1 MAG: methyltransferase [Sulfurimonas sp. CG23_combo_of_CG06-09_8_20_14_all_36_33]PIS26206.1 MAG: methyltransferase [Sulfurimonas sp. CG08_land_8_20_14_0_20_36_33]PIU34290.1 MAG: methyltransferase [Sulfurimonas sp. CG07_land_8_20_14_0_80_36_56]PIV02588.1 MAG: methyltransferase [Sulfurimonas sp. CG03_land_8_20_14_0_80_36_25]PIV34685.1 MAG: methyltransferase [Su
MLLYQPESGYCYNSDSIFLYDFIDSFKPKGRVLDVGAGCGVLGLLVARDNKKVKLEAVEKQEPFIHYAQTNARVNKIEYKMHEGDFLELAEDVKYDYIISNPPFYHDGASRSEDEMLFNARYNINLPIKDFFKKVSRVLKPQSHFIFCYDASQFGLICAELDKVNLRVIDVQFVHPKIDKKASLVMIHARNGSKSLMKVWEPFISFEGNEVSQKAEAIYKKAKTQSIKCLI